VRGLLGSALLILGVIILGFSLGVSVSITRGDGVKDYATYTTYNNEYYYEFNIRGSANPFPPFHMIYDPQTDEVVRVVEGALIGCIIYSPPNSNLTLLLEGDSGSSFSIYVDAGKYGNGSLTINMDSNSSVVKVAHFEDRGIYPLLLNIKSNSSVIRVKMGFYGPVAQEMPFGVLLALIIGFLFLYIGSKLVLGRTAWLLAYSFLPLMVFLVSLVIGLGRPFEGRAVCQWFVHIPEDWSLASSPSLHYKLIYMSMNDVFSQALSLTLLVMTAISSALLAAGYIEVGLGEYESILFPSRAKNYITRILLLVFSFTLLPGIAIVLGHLVIYNSLPDWALQAGLMSILVVLGPVAVVVSVTSLTGIVVRRASVSIVVGVMLALLPLIGILDSLFPHNILYNIYLLEDKFSHTTSSDPPKTSLLSIIQALIELEAPLLLASTILLVIAWFFYSRWEP